MAEEATPPAVTSKPPANRQPAQTFRYSVAGGSVFVSVWTNQIETKDGTMTAHSVSCQRSYHDGSEWKYTGSFRGNDLFTLIFAVEKAINWIMEERENQTVPF